MQLNLEEIRVLIDNYDKIKMREGSKLITDYSNMSDDDRLRLFAASILPLAAAGKLSMNESRQYCGEIAAKAKQVTPDHLFLILVLSETFNIRKM